MSVLSDVPADGLKELAGYLKRFPDHDEDADQYWYQLACTLRKRHKNKFSYSEQFLVTVGQAEDKAALTFLKDLSKRGVELTELVECFKIIKCRPALNYFQQGATPPELTGPQESHLRRLKVGETLSLSVEAKCRGTLQYCWFHDQKPLVQANSPQLLIDNITSDHRGTYICKVTNLTINDTTLSSVYSQPVKLEVYDEDKSNGIHTQETSGQHRSPPPVIITHPSDVLIWPGHRGPVTFTCRAEQGVVYDWYKDDRQFHQSSTSGQLVLNPARDHVGGYYCEVVNNGGKKRSRTARLSVGSDIDLTCLPAEEQICHVGEKVELSCEGRSASANRLQFKWFRMDGDRLVESVGEGENFCTIVSSKHLRGDAKLHYCCKVTTSTDPSNCVQSQPFVIKVETVWIVDQPRDIKAQLKQRAQLTCTGCGEGKLTYVWLKSSSESGHQSQFKYTQLGVLPFDKLSNEDAGYYQCIVRNKFGHVESRIVQVTPLQAHALESGEPIPTIKVLRQPRSCVVLDGKPFRLVFDVMCSSTADQLSYQWYFSGSKISGANSHVYIRESTCLMDCGPYWCEVRTKAGSVCVSQSARVEFQYPEEMRADANWRDKEGERFFRTKSEERFAREKIALLIGNQSYQEDGLGTLNTPMNDILAVQAALIPLDFKVFSLVDLTHAEMQASLNMFYSLLKVPGTYALFYFSGHGFSTGNRNNFLIPVDSPPDSDFCFQVDSVIKRMQDTFSRVILYLDACKVTRDVHSSNETAYPSIQNLSNMFEEWSCFDNATALDSLDPSATSEFNLAFINAISEKKSLSKVHEDILTGMRNSAQKPVCRMAMADAHITLQDPIMVDEQELVETLDLIQQEYVSAHSVPDPVVLKGHQMNELNVFAELKLYFSAVLTNTLRVDANLHQLHDKTSSASVQFDIQFLSEQGVSSSQSGSPLNGQDEGLCATTSLLIKDLQKLKHPLKLLMRVCLWESGQERCANISYTFKERPFIAQKCLQS